MLYSEVTRLKREKREERQRTEVRMTAGEADKRLRRGWTINGGSGGHQLVLLLL